MWNFSVETHTRISVWVEALGPSWDRVHAILPPLPLKAYLLAATCCLALRQLVIWQELYLDSTAVQIIKEILRENAVHIVVIHYDSAFDL